tara:strand:- start:159 stop:416 length:258 start_codon:yes stop_codon:yes gene_type:complete
MDKTNNSIKVLYTLVIMLTVWCTYNTANTGGFITKLTEYRTEVHTFQRQVASLIDMANAQEQQDEVIKAVEDVLPVNEMKEEATE